MKKYIFGIKLKKKNICIFLGNQGYCKQQTPEQLVRDFYAWHFEKIREDKPYEQKPAIYAYVTKETIEYIDGDKYSTTDYFTKIGMYSYAWRNVKVKTGQVIAMSNDMFVVPVTFKIKDGNYQEDFFVVAFVKKENGSFYITKVVDIYPYF